ncbi:MAG: hypothetical protein NVV82_06825 [Sporocytophaga sp.]|nr:hypothetical protein [Sporocytophaga sp.]
MAVTENPLLTKYTYEKASSTKKGILKKYQNFNSRENSVIRENAISSSLFKRESSSLIAVISQKTFVEIKIARASDFLISVGMHKT